MRIERQATSVSWIPSDSIPGLIRFPFEKGLMHYDPPPPLTLTDLESMRQRGEFRFANKLGVWLEVEDGEIKACGYSDHGLVLGYTPITAGPIRVLLPTKPNPEIRQTPHIDGNEATFVQTAGSRPGFSFVRPTLHWPFFVTRPFTIWTTIELTVNAEGSCRQRLVGASPFPRHWLYAGNGELTQKVALTRNEVWVRTVFGTHTPWGGEDEAPVVAEPESELDRTLAERIMRGGERPSVRSLQAGEFLFRQSDLATSVALILDGNFEVRVNGKVVGQVGPGSVVGERASLEEGRRTADLCALTDARVAEAETSKISGELLAELALGHRREEND